ncbi:MAG: transposase, partial [Synechococcales bacterium]|nr:transposase [Synechococcales bacterium]
KRYEFGCKVVIATTSDSNWVVSIAAQHGNPYDGATLKPALKQIKVLTGVQPKRVLVDQGFRGAQYHPKSAKVLVACPNQRKASIKQALKRRNAIEPVIGHSKLDQTLDRNFLKGKLGDCINALLTGCGFNLRKLYRFFLTQSQSSKRLQPV